MPMIDVYAATGTFADEHQLAVDLASAVMKVEQVPDIPLFRTNTAAFIHLLPAQCLANVDGDSTHVRIQVLTNAGALDRDKQLAVVAQLTAIVAAAAGDPSLADRTWVLLTEAPDGGWGLAGHANTNQELVQAARAQLAAGGPDWQLRTNRTGRHSRAHDHHRRRHRLGTPGGPTPACRTSWSGPRTASTTRTATPAGRAAACRWSCSSTSAETSTTGIPR